MKYFVKHYILVVFLSLSTLEFVKLKNDIERLEVSSNDPTNLCSSPLDEIRLKHLKELRDKNVTKRQN